MTTMAYDLLGRRTQIASLDAGTTDLYYDAMGNMVRKQDSNLRNRSVAMPYIRYEYDLDQLVGIRYPEGSATMDVKFEYGPPGAPGNGAGRIVRVVDDAGEETRAYGELGELVRTTRTLRPLKPLEPPMVFETRFDFDEYGRMNWIKYPDGETVGYAYDRGGLLRYARGDRPATVHYPAASEVYLQFMAYDEFGQRRFAKLGNGALTKYGYYPQNHRLAWLDTASAGRTLQNLTYGYDLVGNVTFQSNGLGPPTDTRSGDVSYEFLYDSLDRLKWAKGVAAARPGVTDEFQTDYAYSAIHNMTWNKQVHKVTTVTDLGTEVAYPPHTNHDFTYTYDAAKPHQATQIGDMFLTYDWNGNTSSECRDHADPTCSVNHDHYREYHWTEDNRLASVIDGGGKSVTRFLYDAAGERLVKYGTGGASITVGQFFNLKGRTAATKHIFAGTTRLASKLLPPAFWPSPTLGAPLTTTVATTSTGTSGTNQVGGGWPNDTGCVPSDYQPQKCPILVNGEPVVPYPFQDTKVRPETYYYHPDHLGSTSWVTDQNGKVHEHVEYFPYGEVWRDPVSDRDGAGVKGQKFLFSGKELDEETGLYYFGERYLNPERARWLSTDPMDRFTSTSPVLALNLYEYALWNPLRFVDPHGTAEKDRTSAQSAAPAQSPGTPPAATGRDAAPTGNAPQSARQAAALGQRARAVFGETGGLYPQRSDDKKSIYRPENWDEASAADLAAARREVGAVSERNSFIHRASARRRDPIAQMQYRLAVAAASDVANSTLPTTTRHFFIRQLGVGPQAPGWAGTSQPIRSYGPFVNPGGGDVPRGTQTYIDFYDGIR